MSHQLYKDIGSPEIRLIEECSELIQAVAKAQRFGYFNYHPDRPGKTNMDDVKAEMDDVVEAMESLQVQMRLLSYAHFKGSNEATHGIKEASPAFVAETMRR